MTKDDVSKDWYRDGYLLSTKPELIQPDAFNAALASDLIWWAKPLPRDQLLKALSNSLCMGLYALPDSTSSIAGTPPAIPHPFHALLTATRPARPRDGGVLSHHH